MRDHGFTTLRPRSYHRFWSVPLALLLAFAALLTVPAPARAASTIAVTTTTDENGTGAGCSLREAFASANTNTNVGGCTGSGGGVPFTINVPAGNYNLTVDELRIGGPATSGATFINTDTRIVGAGAATTIINQTVTGRRVFDVNPPVSFGNVTPNVSVSISGVTITGGNAPSDTAGGAGIFAGGPGNALTLSNCIITGNSVPTGGSNSGAGVKYFGGGVLTINNCQITNNTAGGVGGGVDYSLLNSSTPAGANQGGLSITNSTFSGNSAGASATGAGGAIRAAVTTQAAGQPSVFTISNNTFTGNTAPNGFGGAIYDAGVASSTMRFNRFFNNTASSASGIYKLNNTGTLNATQNWWGCNAGPGNTGCASIGGQSANITTAPRLVLSLTSASSSVPTNGSTALTASFLTDSAASAVSASNLGALANVPVTFGATLGTISGAQTAIQTSGTATATYNAGSTPGAGSATATVDGQQVSVNITITRPSTTVTSINRAAGSPTNAGSVSWTVVFASALSGLTASNFTLANTGLTGSPAITGVTPTGSAPATTWTVTASTGSGNGTLGLNLVNDTGLTHSLSNLPFTGQVYTIDKVAPDTTITGNPTNPTSSTSASFTFTSADATATFECSLDGATFATCTSPQNYTSLTNGSHTFQVRAKDAVGNVDATPASYTWTVDTIRPSVTINQAAGQADPTNSSPINFTVVFGEPVSGFTSADVTLSGGAGATTAVVTEIAPNNGTTYNVAVSGMTTSGTVMASIPANAATDAAGNGNNASTSTDNTVTYTAPTPDLTITKSHTGNFLQGQTGAQYTITVSNGGTGATNGTVTVVDTLPAGLTATAISGGGWTCDLATLTCTRSDALAAGASHPAITLTVNVASNAPASVTNSATVSGGGETNTANNSANDQTTIGAVDTTKPSVTINQAAGQADPTNSSPINFTVVFDEPVSGFSGADVTLSGTAGATTATVTEIAPNNGTTYNVAVSGMTTSGTVMASIPANAATDAAGNGNNASTSTDNTVTYTAPTPDLTITKSHTGNFLQGQTGAQYTITVSNGGNAPSSGTVTVVDTLPAGLTATAISGGGWSCTLATLTCTRSDALAGGSSYPTITLTVNVASNAPSSLTNTATVSGGGDQSSNDNTANDPTTIGTAGQLIKAMTFEGASLTGNQGADSVVGPVQLVSGTSAIKGSYSARIPNTGDTYLQENFSGADDLYVSFSMVLHQLPSDDVRIPLISNAGKTITSLFLLKDGTLQLREQGNKLVGSTAPLALGTVYRIGLHQKKGAGGNAVVEGWLAQGDAPFGAPFAAKYNGTWISKADRLRIGATISTALNATLDDIKLAEGAMPQ